MDAIRALYGDEYNTRTMSTDASSITTITLTAVDEHVPTVVITVRDLYGPSETVLSYKETPTVAMADIAPHLRTRLAAAQTARQSERGTQASGDIGVPASAATRRVADNPTTAERSARQSGQQSV